MLTVNISSMFHYHALMVCLLIHHLGPNLKYLNSYLIERLELFVLEL